MVARAADHARELHAGDVRKGSGESYFEGHLAPVAAIVEADGGTPEQVAAAYLHDAAEDHGGHARLDDIRTRFGDAVADIVRDLSDSLVDTTSGEEKQEWHARKHAYLAALGAKPDASLAVAAADKLHNATSILEDHARFGDEPGPASRPAVPRTSAGTTRRWPPRCPSGCRTTRRCSDWSPSWRAWAGGSTPADPFGGVRRQGSGSSWGGGRSSDAPCP